MSGMESCREMKSFLNCEIELRNISVYNSPGFQLSTCHGDNLPLVLGTTTEVVLLRRVESPHDPPFTFVAGQL